uniref:Si:dkey-28a3.2 n=1 Tax=Danio rerio TaxID=7955 RepID=A0ACD6B7D1_DANRE|nr:uncharacterized protein si:dkey-28a3.2 [Danio rerio]XP_009301278.1 uncharacterized protein si:dkey-28a3.2 [Danio rerio]|eukprot:XP_009301277.1 uncharacterized protein si:dkey-28a3.2 [Danio rerio]
MSRKTTSKRHYKPSSEIDDAALARKREYWRSKKREQRARKSSAKKKIGDENLRLCRSVGRHEPFVQIPRVSCGLPLRNCDVSCKLEEADISKNFFNSGLLVSERNVASVTCQNDRWFQKTKLNHVLPQNIQKTSTNSMKGSKNITRSSNTDAKTVELSNPTSHLAPTTCLELYPMRTGAQKTGASTLNGKQLAMCPQKHASVVLPVHSNQNCLKTLNISKCKAYEILNSHKTKRRTGAFASKHNAGVTMTEEETAAKRREIWRIKKREQRAKLAARLAREGEGSLGKALPSCVGITHALSPAYSKALRGIKFNSVNPICINQQPSGAKLYSFRTRKQQIQGTKLNHASLSSCILQPSSRVIQPLNKSKVPTFAHTQTRQKQMRKYFLGASRFESPEDQHARQKEYWRIKKREQRARLAMVMKARLKERDAVKHQVRSHHASVKQMCVQTSKASALGSSSQTIGGFIRDDRTMMGSISKGSPEASLSVSYNFSCTKRIVKSKVGSLLHSYAQPATKLVSPQCSFSTNPHQGSLVKSRLARDAVKSSTSITNQPETLTEEERITRLREYWRIKKREQRAKRAARLRNGLLRSKVLVLKQREQNKKSNQRHSITSSVSTTVCESSTTTPTPIKEEHVYPSINAVFSIPKMNPCIGAKETPADPPTAVDHQDTTLQAVASMKKLLEELVGTPKDNAIEMHVKSENEPVQLTEDTKPDITLQQDVLECDISAETSFKVVKMSPRASSLEDTSHHKSHNVCEEVADESSTFSPEAQCGSMKKFNDDRADLMMSYPLEALQEQGLGESDELQRKREYWRLMKRQQRARKANKEAAICRLALQTPTKKQPSTTVMRDISQDTSTCRLFPCQKRARSCTKPVAGLQTQSSNKSRTNRSQITATPNPQEDSEEVIRRRRMQWRIKKQEQRARKAESERKLRQMMATPHSQATQGQNTSSFCSAVVLSKNSENLNCSDVSCQTALKEEESSFALNAATERHLSQAQWRNVYLMDLDPVIPLLVCMVCGEQQYSVSVEGVKAHIEEVHPHTLSLGELEHRGILNAWDKQVALREHFITHQLQQQ